MICANIGDSHFHSVSDAVPKSVRVAASDALNDVVLALDAAPDAAPNAAAVPDTASASARVPSASPFKLGLGAPWASCVADAAARSKLSLDG